MHHHHSLSPLFRAMALLISLDTSLLVVFSGALCKISFVPFLALMDLIVVTGYIVIGEKKLANVEAELA